MVKKLALASLFLSSSDVSASLSPSASMSAASSTATSWQWPSCTQARTLSFSRDHDVGGGRSAEMMSSSSTRQDYKTSVMNPAYSCFLDSSEHSCLSTTSSAAVSGVDVSGTEPAPATGEVDEVVIRGLRSSSRLFFEPEATSSIVKPATRAVAFGGGTAMAIDSADPYGDFRRSMEEMVMSHGGALKSDDWGWLEEMLGWYLKANGRKTHGLIVGAFVDLLVALSSPPTSSSSSSFVKEGKQSDEC